MTQLTIARNLQFEIQKIIYVVFKPLHFCKLLNPFPNPESRIGRMFRKDKVCLASLLRWMNDQIIHGLEFHVERRLRRAGHKN